MHPKTMIALAHEVERDRQPERQQGERRLLARARRLIAGISLRPRLS
jgi:hypothetical protein